MAGWNMDRIMHGGDYNPDQWRHMPRIIDEDMRLMKLAKCNLMSVGMFAWSALEPEEGVFNFGWLDDVLNKTSANGGYVFLATPSAARPAWMSLKYPEVLRVRDDGLRNFHGARHNHCYTSPVYREKIAIINEKLAERYHDHPAVVGWHVSNEYGGTCYCGLCQQAFREYLKDKFKDIDVLNEAWATDFWSHRYNSFDQIEAPSKYGESSVDGLTIEWKRFVTVQTMDFMRHECVPIKKYSDKPITANFMGAYPGLDYFKFKDLLDVASWDAYPPWRANDDDINVANRIAFAHDITRSILGKPFLLMESTPSMVNWMEVCKPKRPGMHKLSSLQAVAHGADSVQYFQWRKSRGSFEKHHGAVVDHVGHENTRVFRDVQELGDILERLPCAGADVKAEAAIIFDWENRWALAAAQAARKDKSADDVALEHYSALRRCGINVDIIDSEYPLDGYKLVIAPMLYMLKPKAAENIRKFVEEGGAFVMTHFSAMVDENSLCFLGGCPGKLMDVMGVWNEEYDALYDGEENFIITEEGKEYKFSFMCDIIHSKGAEVLAKYSSDFYKGMPALTRNCFGKGSAYYMAARMENVFLEDFYSEVTKEAGIDRPIKNDALLPGGVLVSSREKEGEETVFLMNFSQQQKEVDLGANKYKNALTGENISGKVNLDAVGVIILSKEV
ncbi:MAG: beta-galactosidase [Christensenellales bacterium]|jgi:beta-galactosidase